MLAQTWREANTKMKVNMQAFVRGCVWLRDSEGGAMEGHRAFRPQFQSVPKRWGRGIRDYTASWIAQHPGLHTASWTACSTQHPGLHRAHSICTQHPGQHSILYHTASWTACSLRQDQGQGGIRRSPGLPGVTITASVSYSGTVWDDLKPSGSLSCAGKRHVLLADRGRPFYRPVPCNSCFL